MFEKLKATFAARVKQPSITEDDEQQQVALAAALLLLEVAWADHEIEDREIDLVRMSLQTLYSIDEDEVNAVVTEAKRKHEEVTSIYPFTRSLNEQLSLDEKRLLLAELWKLNAFDGSPFHYEENTIRRIAELLYLSHADFINAKLAVKVSEN